MTSWKPYDVNAGERAAYNRSLKCHFDNQRSVNVHDDWSVAKAREDCVPFTIEIHNPENVSKTLGEKIAREVNRQRKPRKSSNLAAFLRIEFPRP